MPHFSYASFVQEWGLDVDIDGSWIVFRAAAEAQSAIVKSVMTQECTMEDMNNLYEATKMGVSLLGDSCAPKFIGSKIYFFKLIDFFSRLILYLVFYYHNFIFILNILSWRIYFCTFKYRITPCEYFMSWYQQKYSWWFMTRFYMYVFCSHTRDAQVQQDL